jgi:hypothetical protein
LTELTPELVPKKKTWMRRIIQKKEIMQDDDYKKLPVIKTCKIRELAKPIKQLDASLYSHALSKIQEKLKNLKSMGQENSKQLK